MTTMNRLILILFVLLILGIGGGTWWYLVDSRNDAFGPTDATGAPMPEVREGLAIYTNGSYGFSIFYPESAEVSYSFDPGYHLGSLWRANALPDAQGTPLVSIVPYHVESETAYPRYFNAMVRIGASADPAELARCEAPAADQGEVDLGNVTIGGRSWSSFSLQDAGMMQYASGVSYRTVSEGKCIAMEKVRTGSSYREETTAQDIPQETLDAEYAALASIVESFSFAR